MDGTILIVLPLEVLPQAAVPRRATQGAEGGNKQIAKFLTDHERWPGKSAQGQKWNSCLNAARIAAEQEFT